MCDIYALGWFSPRKFHQLKQDVYTRIDGLEEISVRVQSEELFRRAETALGIQAKTIKIFFVQLLQH
jgi:hypothetical protein